MFRGRGKIWAGTLVICIIIEVLWHYVPIWFTRDDITISVQADDIELAESINAGYVNKFDITLKKSDADIILSSSTEEIEGYTLHKNELYSPIVLYGRSTMGSHKGGFIAKNNAHEGFKISLRNILVAMEEDKSWSDLGFDESVVSGKVKLCIPDKNIWYYPQVEELFYLTLNDGHAIDDVSRDALKSRVDNIIQKCHKTDNISQFIRDDYTNHNKESTLCVAPEFLTDRSDDSIGKQSSYSYIPVYCDTTTYITINLYSKDNNEIVDKFIEYIHDNNDFMNLTGYRIADSELTFSASYYLDYVPGP